MRPKIGASDNTDRATSLKIISGEANREEIVWGVGVGLEATVWSISPI